MIHFIHVIAVKFLKSTVGVCFLIWTIRLCDPPGSQLVRIREVLRFVYCWQKEMSRTCGEWHVKPGDNSCRVSTHRSSSSPTDSPSPPCSLCLPHLVTWNQRQFTINQDRHIRDPQQSAEHVVHELWISGMEQMINCYEHNNLILSNLFSVWKLLWYKITGKMFV